MAGELPTEGVVVVGCSRRKAATTDPVPALDLYQEWFIPQLRSLLGPAGSPWRDRVLILSARHGLITADTPLTPYDQRMTADRANALQSQTRTTLAGHLDLRPATQALVLLEPLYQEALGDIPVRTVHTFTDPVTDFDAVRRVLNSWSWL
ncbi:DUF6884 domain-containing protein [Streptomyces sp. NPDC058471]|uniref:DUF6884 domain-containing protein n=1 Tax=Streptomyces sp. NPDC058471 TaxID=3346516 RepID=UPI00364D670A